MVKRFSAALLLLFSLHSFAQEGTASPYSYYGLGDMRFRSPADTRGMAGLSVIPDSIHLNLQNPAFYPSLKLTTLSTGATYATYRLKTNDQDEKARRTTLDYLAIGIPAGKFAGSFGLMPYTSVGYKIQDNTKDNLGNYTQKRNYTGKGGVNKAFVGLGYQVTKAFSIGAEFGYFFGNIETSSIYDPIVQYPTRELNTSKVSGAGFNLGAAYVTKIHKKYDFSAAVTYIPESHLTFNNDRQISTIRYSGSNNQIVTVDTLSADRTKMKVSVASRLGFGAAFGKSKKWMAGAEFTAIGSGNANRFADIPGTSYENGFRCVLGGYYIPKYNSFSDYWKRITYRAGFRTEKTGLVVNGKSIGDTAGTLGFGFPLNTTFSNINLGIEYGKRGTRDAGLVEENYLNFSVGLSFNDRWFVRRKYD